MTIKSLKGIPANLIMAEIGFKGQSAIEYLMTYGWMLLVVAVIGGGLFSVIQSESIESSSGFSGTDALIENFGFSKEGKLDMVLHNSASEDLNINHINLSQNGKEFSTGIDEEIDVGDSQVISALGAVESNGGASTVDVEIVYDVGGLENQVVSGTISGDLEVVMSGETETSNWAYIDVSEVSGDVVETNGMDDFYMMQYEASRSDATSSTKGSSSKPVSRKGVVVWANVDQTEARQACKDEGYHLPTNKQWQAATMAEIGGDNPEGNNGAEGDPSDGEVDPINSSRVLAGTGPESWSNELGIYDLNGNVWEWTNDTFDQTSSPFHDLGPKDSNGNSWVDSWNPGVAAPASLNDSDSNEDFDEDRYLSDPNMNDGDIKGIRRGGYYGRGVRSGVFNIYVNNEPSTSVDQGGFRCSIS